jgi:TonB family protein
MSETPQPSLLFEHQLYAPKRFPFACSLVLHGVLVTLAWLLPPIPAVQRAEEPLKVFEPGRTKLVWYRLKDDLPAVTPPKRIGTDDRPKGAEQTIRQPIIAAAPKPVSREQFIWHEAPKVTVNQDLQTPNLIVQTPRAPRRQFTPPPETKPAPQQARLAIEEAPKIDIANPALPVPSGKPRQFVAPPTPAAAPGSRGAVELAAPPSLQASDSAVTGPVNLAIVGLNPTDQPIGPPPEASRPGGFSRAAEVGPPSSGAGSPAGIEVPDLMIGPGKDPGRAVGGARTAPRPPGTEVIYETHVDGLRSALSAPLPPGARRIPRTIEATLGDRVVYTVLVPMPRLPDYSDDWVLWFGELNPTPGAMPRVQAPTPLRKLDVLRVEGDRLEGRVVMSAVIRRDGKLDSISVLNGTPALHQSAVEDLTKWDFRPAVREGAAVDVMVVFDIPFRLQPR